MRLPRYGEYKDSGTWLGLIPSTWAAVRLKWVASVNDDVLPETTNTDYEIEYVDIGSVSLDRGIERTERINFADAPSRARRLVRDGDILVSTVRTYLKAIAPVVTPPGNLVVSTGFAVVRPALQLLSRYGKYALQATGFVDEVISRSTGVSYPAINASDLVRICVPVPPAEEQSAIAAFLDRETAKIDALIAEQEKLIALLAEKRQTTISHAVTKGLNPNAPMKDSGIAWLGEVPAHWEVKQLRHFAEVLRGKFTHRPRNDPAFYDGGYPFVQTGDITGASRYIQSFRQTLNERGTSVSKEFPSGTLVMAIAANIGDVAILTFPAYFPDSIVGLVPKLGVDLPFLYYLMTAMKTPMMQTATVSTQLNLNVDQISSLVAGCPPVSEQAAIAAFLDAELERLEALQAEAERGIELLKERRSALIAAAVTGQIDVRGQVEDIAI
ncbi:restriction endonuclease subunit S [Xanthomonas translucens pv. translucens]|uniref:restriction endonuclease subunit S n=1 Tax=Xanthomonas campestris pv. translucens TaxID=343 RepID=UPI00030635CC|nr:restriction endonuclease subunit S [Xanthomonas translucens]MCC8446931.1 restriction endonuclease subunit S [Xanthomonas translucens pv. translucens]MCT8287165.1 restriction endonuclease subunit S [Xanthomonas translucens pv. translucens]MCT8304823.1 restriction endonuclease subunit S [Xanthomonas translucens pv. translucens]QSQ31721.1 restriction endonuclease subunit S [Xanthomonas translucens pv. translucens]